MTINSVFKIKKIVLTFSLFSTLLSLIFLISNTGLDHGFINIVIFIPIFYGVLYYFLVPNNIYLGPGFIIINFIMLLRYVIFTPFFVLNNYKTSVVSLYDDDMIFITFSIILIELFMIFITINIFGGKENIDKGFSYFTPQNNFFLLGTFIAISLLIVLINPQVLENFYFVFDSGRYGDPDYSFGDNNYTRGSGLELETIRYTLIFINIYFFEKFTSKFILNKKKKYLLLSILPIIISALFYTGTSRFSILLPFLSFIFLISKYYQEEKRKIIPFVIGYILTLIIILTIFKQIRTSSISDGSSELIKIESMTNIINDYTSSYPNTYVALKNSFLAKDLYSYETIINDYFSTLPIIHRFSNMDNRTIVHFNIPFSTRFQKGSKILPLNIQGLMHFGALLFYIYAIITIFLILKFDALFFKSKSMYFSFLFALLGVGLGFSIGHTFTHHVFGRLIRSFIPLLILMYINKKIRFYPSKTKPPIYY